MGETVVSSTNGAVHASSSSDSEVSSTYASPDDQPPIARPPNTANTSPVQEKPLLAHTLTADAVAEHFGTHIDHGLSSEEAAARLARDGPNSIQAGKGKSLWEIFVAQVANALTVVLIIVAAISFAIGDYIEGSVVVAVIVLNIVVG